MRLRRSSGRAWATWRRCSCTSAESEPRGIEIPEAAVHLLFVASGATSAEAVGGPQPSRPCSQTACFPFAVMANRPVVIMQFVKCLESIGGIATDCPGGQCLLTILRSDAGQLSSRRRSMQRAVGGHHGAGARSREESGPPSSSVSSLMEQTQEMWNQRAIPGGGRRPVRGRPRCLGGRWFGAAAEDPGGLGSETCQHFSSPQWQERPADAVAFLKAIGVKQCACLATTLRLTRLRPARSGWRSTTGSS